MESPLNFIDPSGSLMRGVGREAGLALYMLTKK
jgi:hypothetical protein